MSDQPRVQITRRTAPVRFLECGPAPPEDGAQVDASQGQPDMVRVQNPDLATQYRHLGYAWAGLMLCLERGQISPEEGQTFADRLNAECGRIEAQMPPDEPDHVIEEPTP